MCTTNNAWPRARSAAAGASVGALCGILGAAFGNVISSTNAGILSVICVGALLGDLLGGPAGILMGAICGALTAGFGSITGGTTLGVVLTVGACAAIGTWCGWYGARQDRRMRFEPAPDSTAPKSIACSSVRTPRPLSEARLPVLVQTAK